ncbi:MAG: hypothetical protein JRN50_04415 [Nitrososphaerota archaeon]|nr:hypothetical protein [Nitrososphaerota archaeon]
MSRLLGWFALGRPRELGLAVACRRRLAAAVKRKAASLSVLAGRSMLAAGGENTSRMPSVGSPTLV